MNEIKIIQNLQQGKQDKAFRKLYKFYPKVEKHVLINSGSKEEALDIFQDALIVVFNKINSPEFDSSKFLLDGFLINTCKFLWSNELRKLKVRQGSEQSISNLEYNDEIAAQLEKENQFKIIDQSLEQLGKKCQEILEMFYYKSFSMDSIAKKFGYKTVKSAKVQKYKCMESARKFALEMYNAKNELS